MTFKVETYANSSWRPLDDEEPMNYEDAAELFGSFANRGKAARIVREDGQSVLSNTFVSFHPRGMLKVIG